MRFAENLNPRDWDLVLRFIEALKIVNTPTDFEAACKMAHEVRND
jgi:hypothetical protein